MINAFLLQHNPFIPQVLSAPDDVKFIVVDLFCGAGGTTIGFDKARNKFGNKIALIAACINHDHKAIRSHWENHPEVYHFEEDITRMYGMVKHGVFFMSPEIIRLQRIVDIYRAFYPNAKVILWASLECTNFSKAKGGQPRDQDSRTLANHMDRYIHAIEPDYIQIENVVEFMSWGPMRVVCKKNNKNACHSSGFGPNSELKYIFNKKTQKEELAFTPISKKNGQDFRKWEEHTNSLGYRSEWRELNSADFGAYTSRNRLFGCFAKGDLPIVWPEASHSKTGTGELNLFGEGLKKWKAVKDLLDFEDEGESIFTRKKPIVENSLKRIYAGLIKEVAGGKDAFLAQYNSGENRVLAVDRPCNTLTTENRFSIVQTSFIAKYFSGRPMNKITSINNPCGALTTSCNQSVVNVKPIKPAFITAHYGNDKGSHSIFKPLNTIPTNDKFTVVQAYWLDKQYSGVHNHQSINVPAGTIMRVDKHALMTAKGFIYNPSHGGHTMHINQPCATIIARQDKAPLYFIQYKIDPNVRIEIYKDDSETMVLIKEFMALYGISDIKMRMLKVLELKLIQGFPKDYILYGNQSDQKKFIGNSVVPHVVRSWAEAQDRVLLKQVA
ncbi:DNA cytosine methyltransferase [Sphingobacterium anhuiense]|uniref:DNA cytosine methyltransferase n=1 Tax=Sphingobacterium anhuiense TaxID=493780 RepID=UPI003C3066B6